MIHPSSTRRLDAADRSPVHMTIDGSDVVALEGDTLLTAILLAGGKTGRDDFTGTDQAGFCLMGACQSCWVWIDGHRRVRACEIEAQEGLTIVTSGEEAGW